MYVAHENFLTYGTPVYKLFVDSHVITINSHITTTASDAVHNRKFNLAIYNYFAKFRGRARSNCD